MTETISAAQALIFAMFTTSAADNSMNDAEMRRIGSVVRNLPAFRNYDENDLVDYIAHYSPELRFEILPIWESSKTIAAWERANK